MTSIDFSKAPLSAKEFNNIFETKEDVKYFGLLGKAQLWVPKRSMTHFDDRNLFKDEPFTRNKDDDKGDWVSVSVRPQSVIQFIKEEITTEKAKNDLTVIRLV